MMFMCNSYFQTGIILIILKSCFCAELLINIPGTLDKNTASTYRLDYNPPHGNPLPNTTIAAKDIGEFIQFSEALPSTNYEFSLYYSNSTINNWLAWTTNIITAPDPPFNLTAIVVDNTSAIISWNPPSEGFYSIYRLKVKSLLEEIVRTQTFDIEKETNSYNLISLDPGRNYQVQIATIYGEKASNYVSRNFTTKPNTPEEIFVWFRNETVLLILWKSSNSPSEFTHYKVSIDPPDAYNSTLYIERVREPPELIQQIFRGLVPGRAYNISIQTVSGDELSARNIARYRTVPSRPTNVTIDQTSITAESFRLQWTPPSGESEFDKYQVRVSLDNMIAMSKYIAANTQNVSYLLDFNEDLKSGRTYQVTVKTVSGNVVSWPVSSSVTLKPLPVKNLVTQFDENGKVWISWQPQIESIQDSYLISWQKVDNSDGINTIMTDRTTYSFETLHPGRNYSISVQAVSINMQSDPTFTSVVTLPSKIVTENIDKGH